MKVEPLINVNIDFESIKDCKSFEEWVNSDISKAFYLGFLKNEFDNYVPELNKSEQGIELLKSIGAASIKSKKYLKELSRLIEPYLMDKNGFVVLEMVNDVLQKVSLENGDDIYYVAYTLGIYINYLFSTVAES